ncbi:MAG: DUF4166 domain-containing protein [Pseudomonadota bacterium]
MTEFLLRQKLPKHLPEMNLGPVGKTLRGRIVGIQPFDPRMGLQPEGRDRRFQRLLSPAQWAALPAAVQARFLKRLGRGQSVVFRGQIVAMKMSRLGWLLAQAARLIGAPLPVDPHTDKKAASVAVCDDAYTNGQVWTRIYARRHGFPQAVHSVKRFSGPTGLEEHIGAGIGMALRLRVENQSLLFEADHYFLKTPFGRVRLPRWLEPGHMVIGHHDLGGQGARGRFCFTLDLNHRVFGHLIHQNVLFTDMEEVSHG